MTNYAKSHIFFVDDESRVCEVVSQTLEHVGLEVSCFTRAADCLEQLRLHSCDLLITDVKMPEMDGIELLTKAKRIAPWLPVLVITAYGDVPMAIKALKAGASDFIEKPLDRQVFLSAVESSLGQSTSPDPLLGKPLTRTETRVLRLLLDGKSNKEIAHFFYRSPRTIEFHRSHIMRKLGVGNFADLLKRAIGMGLT